MANLATLAASYSSLETQKKSITRNIEELEALKASNIVGQLSFVVSKVHGDVTDITNLSVTPSEANVSLAKLRNLAVGTATELQLTTKDVIIGVSCSITAVEEGATTVDYTADFDVKEIDDNESMSTELELLSSDNQTLKVQVKATYDTVSGLLASKEVELQEVNAARTKVLDEIKLAKNNSAAKSKKEKKSSKKGGQQEAVQDTSAAFDVDSEEPSVVTSVITGAAEVAMTGAQLGLTHRAVLMFGVAAWAIYSMGEYASI